METIVIMDVWAGHTEFNTAFTLVTYISAVGVTIGAVIGLLKRGS